MDDWLFGFGWDPEPGVASRRRVGVVAGTLSALGVVIVGSATSVALLAWADLWTGWSLLAIGFGIGWVLRNAESGLAPTVRRGHAAVLAVLGVVVCEYATLALYDGYGFAPERIPLTDFVDVERDTVGDDPFIVLLWLMTPLVASRVAQTIDEAEGRATPLPEVPPGDLPAAQLNPLGARPRHPRDAEIHVVFAPSAEQVVHRRVLCCAADLPTLVPHLLTAEAWGLRSLGSPGRHPRVWDTVTGSPEEAFAHAHTGRTPANPRRWLPWAGFVDRFSAPVPPELWRAPGRHRAPG